MYCQVSIPVSSPETTSKTASPFIHPRLKSLGAKGLYYDKTLNLSSLSSDGSLSPLSAHDRYSSPVPLTARRQLFATTGSNPIPDKFVPIAPKPPIVTVIPLEGSQASTTKMLSPPKKDGYVIQPVVHIPSSPAKSSASVETVSASCKPRRGGSLELFYRKVILEGVIITCLKK